MFIIAQLVSTPLSLNWYNLATQEYYILPFSMNIRYLKKLHILETNAILTYVYRIFLRKNDMYLAPEIKDNLYVTTYILNGVKYTRR